MPLLPSSIIQPLRAVFAPAVLCAGLLAALPAPDAAAQDRIYTAAELSTPPKVKSPSAAQAAVEGSLPSSLASIGGKVQLQFVINPDGRVDPSTIEVVVASASALGDAAKKAIQKIAFTPPMVDGKAVHARVSFPIIYQAR